MLELLNFEIDCLRLKCMVPLRFPPRKRPRLNPPAPGAGPPFAAIRRASSVRRSPGAPPPTALPTRSAPSPSLCSTAPALCRPCAPHLRSAHSAAFPRPARPPTSLAQTPARPSHPASLARPRANQNRNRVQRKNSFCMFKNRRGKMLSCNIYFHNHIPSSGQRA